MRVKTVRALAVAAIASTLAVAPLAVRAESLSDAMVSAYRTSGLLTQQRALLRAEDENLAVAVAGLRPVINYILESGVSRSRATTKPSALTNGVTNAFSASATLSMRLTVFNFGVNDLQVDLARENVLLARDGLVGVEQAVLLRAVQAFLDVRSAHETAMLQANNVRLITEELRAARDRFEVGEITQTDVSAAEAALAGAKSNEAAARGQLMIAREEYRVAIGNYPNGLQVPPAAPLTVRSLSEAKALARTRHPDILAAQRAVKVAELGVEISHRSMLPTVSANGALRRSYADSRFPDTKPDPNNPFGPSLPSRGKRVTNSNTASVGLEVSGPIYQGGQLSALYRRAKAQAEAARASLHIAVQGVEQSVANAWAQLAVAQASLQARDQEIRANRVALRGAREEATLGARTTLEVLAFEQDLLDAQAARISAQSNQYLAIYNLIGSMGLLTADHLRLGIATYDPEAYFNAVKDAPVYDISPQGERLDAIIETLGRALD